MSDDFYLTPHSRLGKPQNRTPIQFHWAPAAKGILGSQSLCFPTTNKPPSSSSFYCFSFTEETSVCTPTARDSYERLSLAGQALPPGFPSPFLFPDGLSSIETLLTNIQVLSSDPVWLWPCSLITTCIRRLHLTQLSNVEEKKTTHTHAKFDYFKLLCVQTVPEQHASLFTSGQMAARSVSEGVSCQWQTKKMQLISFSWQTGLIWLFQSAFAGHLKLPQHVLNPSDVYLAVFVLNENKKSFK